MIHTPTNDELLADSVRSDVESDEQYKKDRLQRLEMLENSVDNHDCHIVGSQGEDGCQCEEVYAEIKELNEEIFGYTY